jgi:DNA primase
MALFLPESLEILRQRVDLADFLSSYIDLQKQGASYKALCPFHDKKSPSFLVNKGSKHYHCFGCQAHGDAIRFLMDYQNLSFSDAVETLALRYGVHLQTAQAVNLYTGPDKKKMKEALIVAKEFFHAYLLHTEEGHLALEYLYNRGISLEFIQAFEIGLAPQSKDLLQKVLLDQGIEEKYMEATGLIKRGDNDLTYPFFRERITFPIQDATGAIVGFSCRNYKKEAKGGKYINSPETALFKKSRILFGLDRSRRSIAKTKSAIIVEGQLDALSCIFAGLDTTVAALGTAFGEEHIEQLLHLGVMRIFLALDADQAGYHAVMKLGQLFLEAGVEVKVLLLPKNSDPDQVLQVEGKEGFNELLENSIDYLKFLVLLKKKEKGSDAAAAISQIAEEISLSIQKWKGDVLVHGGLRMLAMLLNLPEHLLTTNNKPLAHLHVHKQANAGLEQINPVRILEMDFLRLLVFLTPKDREIFCIAEKNIEENGLKDEACSSLYKAYKECFHQGEAPDTLELLQKVDDTALLSELFEKKVNIEKGKELFLTTVEKILDRNWMREKDLLSEKLHNKECTEEEKTALLESFKTLQNARPRRK